MSVEINIANHAEGIPRLANKIYLMGKHFTGHINDVINSLINMHNSWTGKRYADLIIDFNGQIPQFQKIINTLEKSLPVELKATAQLYAAANFEDNPNYEIFTEPEILKSIEVPSDSGEMKFILEDVLKYQNEIKNSLEAAKKRLNEIREVVLSQDVMEKVWNCNSSNKFIAEYEDIRKNYVNAINTFTEQFLARMQTIINEMSQAESNNTVQMAK